jgi:hypothetical protein
LERASQNEAANGFFEFYRCAVCGRTGSYEVDDVAGIDWTNGCVTTEEQMP